MLISAYTAPPTVPNDLAVQRARRALHSRLVDVASPYLYILPAIALLAVWFYRPLIQTFELAFYNWNMLPTTPKTYVGWSNFSQVLSLPQLWGAVRVTLIFIGGMLVFCVGIPLAVLAVGQGVGTRSVRVYRTLLFIPYLVAPVAAASVWNFLLAPRGGLVNEILGWFRIAPVSWLEQPGPARLSIVLIAGWKILGAGVVILSAGLAAISVDYYEAATIEGATRFQTFRRVIVPLLSPSIMMLVIMATLLSSQLIFPLLNALTSGGPSGATTDIYYLMYSFAFSSLNVGMESATAVLFFIVFALVGTGCVWLLERVSFFDR